MRKEKVHHYCGVNDLPTPRPALRGPPALLQERTNLLLEALIVLLYFLPRRGKETNRPVYIIKGWVYLYADPSSQLKYVGVFKKALGVLWRRTAEVPHVYPQCVEDPCRGRCPAPRWTENDDLFDFMVERPRKTPHHLTDIVEPA